MCVAVVIMEDSPTKSELESMEAHNPHGAGIAYMTPAGIRFMKGLSASQIHAFLDYLPRPVLMHYRWATHGPKTPILAHPFPMDERAITGRELEGFADKVLIHNGVWGSYANYVPDWAKPMQKLVSDTAFAAYAAKDRENEKKILESVAWSVAVGEASKSGMKIRSYGRWMEHEGNWYSNLDWVYSSGRGEGRGTKKKSGSSLTSTTTRKTYGSYDEYIEDRDNRLNGWKSFS